MLKTKKKLTILLVCLLFLIIITACGTNNMVTSELNNSTSEKETHIHSGRYECSACGLDFGEEFKKIILENGKNGVFINSSSNYNMETYTNDNFEIVMNFVSSVGSSEYDVLLGYSSFEKKWTWMLEWGSKSAYGKFETLSSISTTLPYDYCSFPTSPADMIKEVVSTMTYNANLKLDMYNAGFTMKNLGLNF